MFLCANTPGLSRPWPGLSCLTQSLQSKLCLIEIGISNRLQAGAALPLPLQALGFVRPLVGPTPPCAPTLGGSSFAAHAYNPVPPAPATAPTSPVPVTVAVVLKGAAELGITEFDIGPDTAPAAVECILGPLCTVKAPKVPLFAAHSTSRICHVCQQIVCCNVCMASPEHCALDEFRVHGRRPPPGVKMPVLGPSNRLYPPDRVAAFADKARAFV